MDFIYQRDDIFVSDDAGFRFSENHACRQVMKGNKMIKGTLKFIGAFLVVSTIIRVGGAVIFGPEAQGALTIIGLIVAFLFASWFSRRKKLDPISTETREIP